jgi:arsenate reductase
MARTQFEVVMDHNPACATPCKVLGMISNGRVGPRAAEPLRLSPARRELIELRQRLGMTPNAQLRCCETPFDRLGLGYRADADGAPNDAILVNPILMQRPVVIGPRRARCRRPAERVQERLSVR